MPEVQLISITQSGLGRSYLITDQASIGRQADCEIHIVDSQASKQHAQLQQGPKGWEIEDLGSLNGVYINGQRIETRQALVANDVISIGHHAFVFAPNFQLLASDDDTAKPLLLIDDEQETSLSSAQIAAPVPALVDENSFLSHGIALLAAHEDQGLQALIRRLKQDIDYDAAAVLVRDQRSALQPFFIDVEGPSFSISKHIALHVLDTGQALCIPDALGETQFRQDHSVASGKIRSVLAIPLGVGEQINAVLFLSKQQRHFYSDADLQLLHGAQALLSLALVYSQRFFQLHKRLSAQTQIASRDDEILGQSPAIKKLLVLISKVAPLSKPVLIHGETGSGKELVARQLHNLGPGTNKAFVAVNCGALPEHLVESELLGHERGAFSGADKRKPGKLELASGGTLFLDEIGELPLSVQVKLLRALEQKNFYRLGGIKAIDVDFRLLAATHRDLKQMCAQGRFREDLYYRLNLIAIEVPALRQRGADISLLADHFLHRFNRETGAAMTGMSKEVQTVLRTYPWPGNVRELRNVVERMAVLCDRPVIDIDQIPSDLIAPTAQVGHQAEKLQSESNLSQEGFADATSKIQPHQKVDSDMGKQSLNKQVQDLERQLIVDAMRLHRGHKAATAQHLGISRPTLDKKLALYRIDLFGTDA